MVLELRVSHGATARRCGRWRRVFLSYVLSFVYLGIYWNNHHHLLHAARHVDGGILWANLHLLFWLSLFPFGTLDGRQGFAAWPVAVYGSSADGRRRLLVLVRALCPPRRGLVLAPGDRTTSRATSHSSPPAPLASVVPGACALRRGRDPLAGPGPADRRSVHGPEESSEEEQGEVTRWPMGLRVSPESATAVVQEAAVAGQLLRSSVIGKVAELLRSCAPPEGGRSRRASSVFHSASHPRVASLSSAGATSPRSPSRRAPKTVGRSPQAPLRPRRRRREGRAHRGAQPRAPERRRDAGRRSRHEPRRRPRPGRDVIVVFGGFSVSSTAVRNWRHHGRTTRAETVTRSRRRLSWARAPWTSISKVFRRLPERPRGGLRDAPRARPAEARRPGDIGRDPRWLRQAKHSRAWAGPISPRASTGGRWPSGPRRPSARRSRSSSRPPGRRRARRTGPTPTVDERPAPPAAAARTWPPAAARRPQPRRHRRATPPRASRSRAVEDVGQAVEAYARFNAEPPELGGRGASAASG